MTKVSKVWCMKYSRINCMHVGGVEKNTCTHIIHTYYSSRLIKEVTIRDFNKWNDLPPPPEVMADQWKRGCVTTQKCPMRWAKGAIEPIHEAVEKYLVGLLTDANILAIHARRITVQPHNIQLARRIRGDKDWQYLGFTD